VEVAPHTVVEIGTHDGDGALWFRDRLRTLKQYGRITREPSVIILDVRRDVAREQLSRADPNWPATIPVAEADVRAPDTSERVSALVVADARCFLIEDSAHEHDTRFAALDGFAHFVRPGGYFIVEDGYVDVEELRARDDWPRGVLPALRTGSQHRTDASSRCAATSSSTACRAIPRASYSDVHPRHSRAPGPGPCDGVRARDPQVD
jgi:cephalosporin hydroxylase